MEELRLECSYSGHGRKSPRRRCRVLLRALGVIPARLSVPPSVAPAASRPGQGTRGTSDRRLPTVGRGCVQPTSRGRGRVAPEPRASRDGAVGEVFDRERPVERDFRPAREEPGEVGSRDPDLVRDPRELSPVRVAPCLEGVFRHAPSIDTASRGATFFLVALHCRAGSVRCGHRFGGEEMSMTQRQREFLERVRARLEERRRWPDARRDLLRSELAALAEKYRPADSGCPRAPRA